MHESAVMAEGFEIIGRASSAEASVSGEENQRRSAPAIYSPRTSTLVAFLSNSHFGNRVQRRLSARRRAHVTAPHHRISSILCTAPSGRVSPTPIVTMRFKNAYASAEVSNLGTVRK